MNNNFFYSIFENIFSKTAITIISLFGAGVTIFAFLQEKKVELRYEIISNTNVLDFNEEIGKLEVIYDSTNLKKSQENLRIYTVKIINNGHQNLLKEFYDENDPLGLQLSSGRIIEQPEVIQVSNDYLKRNVKIKFYDDKKINFSQVILESGEYYVIKLLVLHKTNLIPEIMSYGKIAGQTNIQVVNTIDIKEKLSFWEKVYYGNIWVQLLRLVSYFIGNILIIVGLVNLSIFITEKRNTKRKKKNIAEFKSLETYRYSKMDDAIFDRYKSDGAYIFKDIQMLIKDENRLNRIYLSKQWRTSKKKKYKDDDFCIKFKDEEYIIPKMIEDGIIFWDKEKLTINQAMKETLDKFVVFLKEKGENFTKNYSHDLENNENIGDIKELIENNNTQYK